MYDKNSIKKFLKPSWKKILIFLLLCVVFLLFYGKSYNCYESYRHYIDDRNCPTDSEYRVYGFPLPYADHTANIGVYFSDIIVEIFFPILGKFNNKNYPNFFFDLIFWYLSSCLVISAWDRIRKKQAV